MFSCPQCLQTFPNLYLRDQHIQNIHRGGMGWFENQQTTVNPDSGKVELKALEHSLAAQREKIEKQKPIINPILAPRPQIEPLVPSRGWVKKSDNSYVFEQEIYRNSTPLDSIIVTLSAQLNQRYGKCLEHKYVKDLTELEQLKQKEVCLDSRLSACTPSDPQFKEIAKELYNTKQDMIRINRDTKPDQIHTLIFEEYCRCEPNTDEQVKWMKGFMDKVVSETEKMVESHKKNAIGAVLK